MLQEGDIFLSISNVGAGDLIALAANQPGFGTPSSVRHESPFHNEIARVSGLGATARAYFVALGFDPDGRYFNPGGLLFSKLTRPLFSTFSASRILFNSFRSSPFHLPSEWPWKRR